jgi:acyl-homoserine lactone acylase PvdQ
MSDKLAKEVLLIAKELVGSFPDQPAPWGKETEDEVERVWNEAVETLDKKLDKNKSFYWEPGRSFAVNIALTGGLTTWYLNIFPRFERPFDGDSLIVKVSWSSGDKTYPSHQWPLAVDKFVDFAKKSAKISDVVDKSIDAVEKKFGIKVPASVRRHVFNYVKKIAKGRQTGNRLRAKSRKFPIGE